MAAPTFPELGILGVRRGGHAKRSTRFDVCSGSGLKTSHEGGTRYRCGTCGRTLRVTVTPFGIAQAQTAIPLTGVTCSGSAPIACTAPLPSGAQAALILGSKSTLTEQDTASGTAESSPSSPFITPAGAPTGLKVGE